MIVYYGPLQRRQAKLVNSRNKKLTIYTTPTQQHNTEKTSSDKFDMTFACKFSIGDEKNVAG